MPINIEIGTGTVPVIRERIRPISEDERAAERGRKILDKVALSFEEQAEAAIDGDGNPDAGDTRPAAQPPGELNPAALHGLAGDVVRAIAPDTEADPTAILMQFLIAFGALVGRGPHVKVEGDQHHTNLFAVIVGASSKARKGTAWGRVREIVQAVPEWPQTVSGLSTGEGLKFAVRDEITRTEIDKKTGFTETVVVDAGVSDKRLLVIESEFAQVLRQAARPGNTLSATIRPAWDTGTLRTLTRTDPVIATGAHICIIGHITADELRADMTATDTANGFANRFIFQYAERSKLLPFGGETTDPGVLANLRERIHAAMVHARTLERVGMTPAARDAWTAAYPALSAGAPGLFGAVTARSEAQCLRLALVYALLDSAPQIDLPHIAAAISLWERAEASARFIFGDALGDTVADGIRDALRLAGTAGLTRTEIRDLFKRHQSKERIDAALNLLLRRGMVKMEKRETGGAPVQVWKHA